MTCSVLAFIEERLGIEAVKEALIKRQLETYDEYMIELKEEQSFQDRITKLAHLRDQDGYMVELKMIDQKTFELQEHNCPILEVADDYNIACGIERDLFSNLLNADVENTHRVVSGSNTCKFIFRDRLK